MPQLPPTATFQFDPATGFLPDFQVGQLVQQFLFFIRVPQPPPGTAELSSAEWVPVGGQMFEHAKWLDGARIERLLGSDLSYAHVFLLPNKTMGDLGDAVVRQRGRFVAVVEPDKTFRGLVDRVAVLEGVASAFLKEMRPTGA
jgi:hypothetical protein